MKKLLFLILAMIAVFGLSISSPQAALTTISINIEFDGVDYTYGTYDLMLGDTVSVALYASESATGLFAAGFDLAFDQTQLCASNLLVGSGWLSFTPPSIDPTGHIYFEAGLLTPSAANETVLMATFDLECIGIGLSGLFMGDLNGEPNWLAGYGTTVLDGQFIPPVEIEQVNNVPVPGAIWLLGSGMLCLFGISRRGKD